MAASWREPRSIRNLGVTLTAMLGLWTLPAKAQQQPDPELGIPVPLESKVKATKGVPIEIDLSADARTPSSRVEFLIRDFPTQGRLIRNIRVVSGHPTQAKILYLPAADSQASMDSFTYAVRYVGGYFSPAARVDIELIESTPHIEVSGGFDFGRVAIGGKEVQSITITNSGDASFQKEMPLTPPWYWVSPADGAFDLAAGDSTTLTVAYIPTEPGTKVFELRFHEDEQGIARLKGDAFEPIGSDNPMVELAWNPDTRRRTGSLEIISFEPAIDTLILDTGARLKSPQAPVLRLNGKNRASIDLVLPEKDVNSYSGFITVRGGNFTKRFPINAEAAPPRLEIGFADEPLGLLDFDEVQPGEVSYRKLILRNSGGKPATVGIGILQPFKLVDVPRTIQVPPLSQRDLLVEFVAPEDKRGPLKDTIEIASQNAQFSIPVQAMVAGGATPEPANTYEPRITITPAASGSGPKTHTANGQIGSTSDLDEGDPSPTGFPTVPAFDRKIDIEVPSIQSFNYVDTGRSTISLGWQIPREGYQEFEVEMRQMSYDPESYQLKSVWVPYHDVSFHRELKNMTATIRGLNPGSIYEFRVFTTSGNGRYSFPSPAVGITTKAPIPWGSYAWTTVRVLLTVAAIAFVLWWWRFYRNGESLPFRVRLPMPFRFR